MSTRYPNSVRASNKSGAPEDASSVVTEGSSGSGPNYRLRAASYARYSSDNQSESSVADQQRLCRERAASMNMVIEPDLEFADHAISGTKLARPGLQQMLKLAKTGRFVCIFFYSLSRLGRESAFTVPVLKQLVREYGVRVVSVSEGMDSEQKNWEMFSTISNMINEEYIRQLSSDVFRGLEGTLDDDYSVGDFRFGYASIPSSDGRITGRGRNAKPKMSYQINEEQAVWVRQVFTWFVDERRPLSWIVRELNRLKVDTDHRSTTGVWDDQPVRRLLRSPKYIGNWPWGLNQNCRRPSDGQISQNRRSAAETQRWQRDFPELRLISDEQFYAAQRILDDNAARVAARRKDKGLLGGSSDPGTPCHMLAGLVCCAKCGTLFHTCGSGAQYMGCPKYRKGICDCKTTLPRDLAEQSILRVVIDQLMSNCKWRDETFEMTVEAVRRQTENAPDTVAQLERSLNTVSKKVKNLLDRIEEGDRDPNLGTRLAERSREQADLQRALREARAVQAKVATVPDRNWFDQQLEQIVELIQQATPGAYVALQGLIVGPIVVSEIEVPGKKRRYYRGVLKLRTGYLPDQLDLVSSCDHTSSEMSSVVYQPDCTLFRTSLARRTLARISSADFVHRKVLGWALWCSIKSWMACSN